jgi:hypothetical protein
MDGPAPGFISGIFSGLPQDSLGCFSGTFFGRDDFVCLISWFLEKPAKGSAFTPFLAGRQRYLISFELSGAGGKACYFPCHHVETAFVAFCCCGAAFLSAHAG